MLVNMLMIDKTRINRVGCETNYSGLSLFGLETEDGDLALYIQRTRARLTVCLLFSFSLFIQPSLTACLV